MADEPLLVPVGDFDCEQCGKHVTRGNRTESPWRIEHGGVWTSLCSRACLSAWTNRPRDEEPAPG